MKINKRDYKFYVLIGNGIESGWEYREDARDHLQDLPNPSVGKIHAKSFLKQRGINPDNDDSWIKGSIEHLSARSPKMVRSRRQPSLPGFPDMPDRMDVRIPKMPVWEQINGDMSADQHGGTIAMADGDHIELLQIQPVREYIGEREAAEVGFPFWTKEAWFDLADLDLNNDDVKSALQSIGIDLDNPEEWFAEKSTPEQRALTIASALLDYGRGDEGPAGWSEDLPDYEVKWWSGNNTESLQSYLADEDEEFAREVMLDDLSVDYEKYGPDEKNPTNGLKVVASGTRGVEITEWTDIEDATGEEQPEDSKIVRVSNEVDLSDLFNPKAKHRGAYSRDDQNVSLVELAKMSDEEREEAVVAAAIAYLGHWGGTEEYVDQIGD